MDAPKGRYRVEEKDGRLVVIDNHSGAPVSPSIPPPRTGGPGAPPAPVVAGTSALDGAADLLVRLSVQGWDPEGRAIVAWSWKEGGEARRWDAVLDPGQQRRLGRALLGVAAGPLLVLMAVVLGLGGWLWIGIVFGAPPLLWGLSAIGRLRRETEGQAPPDLT
jgi:hypothetical protein